MVLFPSSSARLNICFFFNLLVTTKRFFAGFMTVKNHVFKQPIKSVIKAGPAGVILLI